jgi:hypothetical protein
LNGFFLIIDKYAAEFDFHQKDSPYFSIYNAKRQSGKVA